MGRRMRCCMCGTATDEFSPAMLKVAPTERACLSCEARRSSAEEPSQPLPVEGAEGREERSSVHREEDDQCEFPRPAVRRPKPCRASDPLFTNGGSYHCTVCGRLTDNFSLRMVTALPWRASHDHRVNRRAIVKLPVMCLDCEKGRRTVVKTERRMRCSICGIAPDEFSPPMLKVPDWERACVACDLKRVDATPPRSSPSLISYLTSSDQRVPPAGVPIAPPPGIYVSEPLGTFFTIQDDREILYTMYDDELRGTYCMGADKDGPFLRISWNKHVKWIHCPSGPEPEATVSSAIEMEDDVSFVKLPTAHWDWGPHTHCGELGLFFNGKFFYPIDDGVKFDRNKAHEFRCPLCSDLA